METDPLTVVTWPADTALAWCVALAQRLRSEDIRPHGQPYLTRYFLAGWNPYTKQRGPAVFLHHFVASDPNDAVHSHPWAWSSSLVLVGGYREYRCTGERRTVREYRPGDVNVLAASDQHRIELLDRDCWTLFLVGDYAQPWGFYPAC
jgi:hypothetical protein